MRKARGLDPIGDGLAAVAENGASRARQLELIQRAERVLRTSATALSRRGEDEAAARAEKWASWLRLAQDEPDAVERLFSSMNGSTPDGDPWFLDRALEGAISLVGASFGNIQLVHPSKGTLRIAAQRGFDRDFLEYFAEVGDASSACGRAAKHHAQMVIPDVDRDADFAPHREIAAASGFRAVQSTPIVGSSGRLLGILSTHFRRPHRPTPRQLQLVNWYAHRIGAKLSRGARIQETVLVLAQAHPKNDPSTLDIVRLHLLHARHEEDAGRLERAAAARERARRLLSPRQA